MSNGNYDNNNSGALFINEKRTKDTHPHLRGTATVDGVEYWVSCWTKTSQGGKKYQSLAFTPKDDQPARTTSRPATNGDDPFLGGDDVSSQGPARTTQTPRPAQQPAPDYDNFDDDIPF